MTELANVKAQFPIFKSIQDAGQSLHYLDNAATAHKPQSVIKAITNCYSHHYGPIARGLYSLAEKATTEYERARQTVAEFIGAGSDCVCFTKSTTESINMVAQAALSGQLCEGDEVWVTEAEHHSNYLPWLQLCAKTGASLHRIPIDDKGDLQLPTIEVMQARRVKCVAISLVSNVLGQYIDIGKLQTFIQSLKNLNIVTVVDAAQAVAHQRINVKQLGCDFLAFSGHKMYGPTGIGVLYVAPDKLDTIKPVLVGGGMVDWVSDTHTETEWVEDIAKMEAGSPNLSGAVGLAAAVSFIQSIGIDAVYEHVAKLSIVCGNAIQSLSGYQTINERHQWPAGIVTFVHSSLHPHDIAQVCSDYGVAIRAGHHCAQPLMTRLGYDATARVSLGVYNNTQDIEALINALKKAESTFL